MPSKTKKVWVTKYLFTKGIFQQVVSETSNPIYVYADNMDLHGDDWHETKELAIAHAEKMKKNKIDSLKRQLALVESMEF